MKKLFLAFALVFVSLPLLAEETSEAKDQEKEKWPSRASTEDLDWAVTGYVAWLSPEQLGDMIIGQAKLTENKLYAVALTKRLVRWDIGWDFEVEGQLAKHDGPLQDHWEINAMGNFRWNRFYWDRYLNTSFAAGLGLSYATEEGEFEIIAHGDTSKLMTYILVELDFSLPKYPKWALSTRIHHRSSAYGTFNDNIQGASNAFGVGLKYRW